MKDTEDPVWIQITFQLVDPQYRRPDVIRGILFSPVISMNELLDKFREIQILIREKKYIINDVRVLNG